ncbi:hypothetical protein L1887_49926 [Cichorium endivia]|nr:hypothetical protein L1887_49926 [Cichorium endivia]
MIAEAHVLVECSRLPGVQRSSACCLKSKMVRAEMGVDGEAIGILTWMRGTRDNPQCVKLVCAVGACLLATAHVDATWRRLRDTYDSHVVEADGGAVHADAEEGHEETHVEPGAGQALEDRAGVGLEGALALGHSPCCSLSGGSRPRRGRSESRCSLSVDKGVHCDVASRNVVDNDGGGARPACDGDHALWVTNAGYRRLKPLPKRSLPKSTAAPVPKGQAGRAPGEKFVDGRRS